MKILTLALQLLTIWMVIQLAKVIAEFGNSMAFMSQVIARACH